MFTLKISFEGLLLQAFFLRQNGGLSLKASNK